MLGLGIGKLIGVPHLLEWQRKTVNDVSDWRSNRKTVARFPFLRQSEAKRDRIRESLKEDYDYYVTQVSIPDMAVSLELAVLLQLLCESLAPKRILDLGSGFSSYVFRKYASVAQGCEILSVDDDAEWLEASRNYLKLKGVDASNCITWKEFQETPTDKFDLILHDLGKVPFRQKAFDEVVARLDKNGIILLDDVHKLDYAKYLVNRVESLPWQLYSAKKYTYDQYRRYSAILG